MKKPLLLLIAALVAAPAFGEEWTYRTNHDSFFNKEERTAVIRSASGGAGSNLMIYNDSKGAEFVMLSASKIKCFPTCVVFVKFDENEPEIFPARADRIVSASAMIGNYGSFIQKMNAAKKVTFRIPRFDTTGDIKFDIDAPFDPERFNDARELIAIEKQCKDNAVNENYSDCMARLAKGK